MVKRRKQRKISEARILNNLHARNNSPWQLEDNI